LKAGRGRLQPHATAPRAQGRNARLVAVRALLAWQEGQAEFLDDALARSEASLSDDRDQGLARELALGALRHGMLYDAVMDQFLKRSHQPFALRACLRIGCHQLFALDRVPPHAAVAESVGVLRELGLSGLAGVANAVLRRLAEARLAERTGPGPLGRLPETLQPTDLAERHGLPELLIEHLRGVLDQDPTRTLAALNVLPPLCTRTRPGKAQPQGHSIVQRDGPWTWWDEPHEALAAVADGLCVVQDRAQGEVVAVARPRPGEWVLDACAAPGGKSSAFIDAGCRVVAADRELAKVAQMPEPPARLVQDSARPALAGGAFDLVVVDAPCSNSGVLARRPEARWRYQAEALRRLGNIQRALVKAAVTQVAPDGRLLYATCSLAPQENQAIAHTVPGWKVMGERLSWPTAWQSGGYAALLVRC